MLPNIIGLGRTEIAHGLPSHLPPYRASQLFSFLYRDRGTSWQDASFLPASLRSFLQDHWRIDHGRVERQFESGDASTERYLMKSPENTQVETVLITNALKTRTTLCVSSQAGCSLKCSFCHTGAQGFKKNLLASEILGQLLALRPSPNSVKPPITNVVFMGQGEPLYNWKQVSAAVKIMTDPAGLALSHSKVTISTSGIAPLIPAIAEQLGVMLAISLHAPTDALRSSIMPINNTYPIESVMQACKQYLAASSSANRRITFEYVMLADVNDADACATQLVSLMYRNFKPDDVHFNLLPFNVWPGAKFKPSRPERIDAFRKILEDAGLACTVRTPKGRDIMAACGQLQSVGQQIESL